jgi:hypothetical protein
LLKRKQEDKNGGLATQIALQFALWVAQQQIKGNQRFPQIAFGNFFYPHTLIDLYEKNYSKN